MNGKTVFYADGDFSYAGSLNKNHHVEKSKMVEVQCETLDSFVKRNNIIPDLVKIDVERHEPEVIEGFMGHIKSHQPAMLIEVLDESIGARLRDLFQNSQYLYFSVNDKTKELKRMREMGKSEDFNVLVITEKMAQKLGLATNEVS
jgi:hypothetical protein